MSFIEKCRNFYFDEDNAIKMLLLKYLQGNISFFFFFQTKEKKFEFEIRVQGA
jgi:hypothetical protein